MTYLLDRVSLVFLFFYMVEMLPLRFSVKKTSLLLVVSYILVSLLDIIGVSSAYPMYLRWFVLLLEIVVVQASAILLAREKSFYALFIGITSALMVMPGDISAAITREYVRQPSAIIVVQILVDLVLCCLCHFYLKRRLDKNTVYSDPKWRFFCMFAGLFYVIVTLQSKGTVSTAVGMDLTTQIANLGVVVLMIFSYVLFLVLMDKDRRERELEDSVIFLTTYASGVEHEARVIRESEKKMSLFRHDIRHYLRLMNSFLEKGQPEKISELLEHMDADLMETSKEMYVSNVTVNAILAEYSQLSLTKHVAFELNADVPETLPNLSEYELAAVVANLLENAFRAAGERPEADGYVKCHIFRVKEMLVLEVENNCIARTNEKKRIKEQVPDERHGYGLLSIQAFAEKYHALFQYTPHDDIFAVKLVVKY